MGTENEITIAICTLNAEKTIEDVLKSCLNNCIQENIIIVDGKSTDKTVELAKKYTTRIYQDAGQGLAAARNIALDKCYTDYILYIGPDNLLPANITNSLLNELKSNDWVGISSTSLFSSPKSYYAKCFNIYKKAKYPPGEKKIIGTPWMYITKVLNIYRWNENNSYSDDTELCSRLHRDKKKVGISKNYSTEIGDTTKKEIKQRWEMYGKSDYQFFMSHGIKFKRISSKIRSFFNAFIVDFYIPITSTTTSLKEKLYILPFLAYIVTIRHLKFLKLILKNEL